MKRVLSWILVSILSMAIEAGAMELLATVANYQKEIATARTLLDGYSVQPEEYEAFKDLACSSGAKRRHFYAEATERGLEKARVKDLCTTVQVLASVAR